MAERWTIEELAEAVADGQVVDWAAVEAAATDDAERVAIERLKKVQQLAGRLRSPGSTGARESGAAIASGDATADDSHPHWGHLTILEKIGEGAFGEVYRAHDPKLERDVALKLLRSVAPTSTDGTLVIEEGRLLARVRHPNIVTVYGADRLDERVGLWMEFVNGRTLEQELQERGPFDAPETTRVGIDLARALAAVHGAGLVHRDVKAQNVMRDTDGRLVLMDFGTGREQARPSGLSGGDLAGTPLYVAPEVLDGESATVRSDIYSLGVLLYHLVTGSYPTTADTLSNLVAAHRTQTRESLGTLRPNLPAAFVEVVERAAAFDPGRRYGNAADMEAALSNVGPAIGKSWKQRWLAGIALAAAVAAAAVLMFARPWSNAALPPPVNARADIALGTAAPPLTTPSMAARKLYALAITSSNATGVTPDLAVQERFLREAIAADSTFASAYLMLAVVVDAQRRPRSESEPLMERARQLAETATVAERSVIEGITHYWRAREVTDDAQRKEARLAADAFEAALLIEPSNSLALSSLHSTYSMLGRSFEAATIVAGSADTQPLDFSANVGAAVLRAKDGDLAGANYYWQKAAEVEDPKERGIGWFRLFPAERDWAQGLATRASQAIDVALANDDRMSPNVRANLMRDAVELLTTLGCTGRATKVAESIAEDQVNPRAGAIAMVLQRREAYGELRDFMMSHATDRLGYLLRHIWIPVGRLDELKAIMNMRGSKPDPVIDIEIAFAEGHFADTVEKGNAYLDQKWEPGSHPALRVPITVGQALVAMNDPGGALRLLETYARRSALSAAEDSQGYDWMLLRADLARLYRNTGRVSDATRIEQDLLSRLAVADPDFPLFREIKQRSGR